MKKGYTYTLGVLTIMILLTITVGTSYSYYTVGDKQTGTNDLVATCFKIDFAGDQSSKINLANAYPMSDTKGEASTPYTFTVTNTCNASNSGYTSISYDITLNTLVGQTSNLTPYLKYKLDTQSNTMLSEKINNNINANLKTVDNDDLDGSTIDKTYALASGTLAPGASNTHSLRLWIDEEATNEIFGYQFNGQIVVYAHTT